MMMAIMLFTIMMILLSVAFFTLMERKVLSYIQYRKGPNKIGVMGIIQPMADGIKLFSKEQIWPTNSNINIYYMCPLLIMIQSLFVWLMYPTLYGLINFKFGLMFLLCCMGMSIYWMILSGWSSNSSYSMLGSMRSISQSISYEISLSMIMLTYFMLMESYNLMKFYLIQTNLWMMTLCPILFFCWISCCMAETNRTPFDFSEGESELVSGFNVEYSAGTFALLFMGEYSSMIFMSMISCMMFMGGNFWEFSFFMKISILCFLFIWTRGTFPRYRYDKLMYLTWKCYLPLSINMMLMFILIKMATFYHFFL